MGTEDIVKASPVNSTAARVTSKGVNYNSPKQVNSHTIESETPLSTKPFRSGKDLSGTRRGRLVVVGLSANVGGRWVCRCDCGVFVLRKPKAIKNEKNKDRCEQCRQMAYQIRVDEFRRNGANASDEFID